jgi:hypothetical protein
MLLIKGLLGRLVVGCRGFKYIQNKFVDLIGDTLVITENIFCRNRVLQEKNQFVRFELLLISIIYNRKYIIELDLGRNLEIFRLAI